MDTRPEKHIADYAVIGDCRTAALIGRGGSIDWLCLPHFSAPSVFGALLDPAGGRFAVQPAAPFRASRRYVDGTNVLETTFVTESGAVRVTDLMPVGWDAAPLQPMREVLRVVDGLRGAVELTVEIAPRPNYGRTRARLEHRRAGVCAWTWGNEILLLHADVELATARDDLRGRIVIRAGEQRGLSLGYTQGDIASLAPLGESAGGRLDATVAWWRKWATRCAYRGPYRDAVLRSALALKLMTYPLSGAVIAAPTTSLPETLGGTRNWDYRYCWLRDAALTMRAFTRLGYMDEAARFLDWLLHATRLTWPELGVLYDVYGKPHLPEHELDHWRGFGGAQPVRIGNAACAQLQLDVYGALAYAACNYVESGGHLERDERRLLRGFGETVCHRWREPDHGFWEVRGAPRHYTFSKVMCWSVLDSLLKLHELGQMSAPTRDFEWQQRTIAGAVEQHGFDERIGSYVGVFGGSEVDASALLMCGIGYRPAHDPRMRSTYECVRERLGCNGLIRRYETRYDGMPGAEGAFGICSFWAVDGLARRGDEAEAHRVFDSVAGHANDVGLLSEEIDPDSGALLGNFPQAYTHVGLINAAVTLAEVDAGAAARITA